MTLVVFAGLLGTLAAFGASPAHAVTTFTVNSTNDTNGTCDATECTLREAINAANAAANSGGPDAIEFDIPGSGVQTISPASALPIITEPVTIDGYSQTGSAPATATTDAVLLIELDGTNAGFEGFAAGLRIGAGGSTVRGLAVNRFNSGGISLDGLDGNGISGNYIGTDASGALDRGNSNFGVRAENGSAGNTIGGATAAARNVISGNSGPNVEITNPGTYNNIVAGNYVGTDASGTQALGNGAEGVVVRDRAASTRIGTDANGAGEGNVVSGNGQDGIEIAGPNSVISGNLVGVDRTGTVDLGNGRAGIQVFTDGADTTIGGTTAAARNVISGNSGEGITFNGGIRGVVWGNLIGTDVTGAADLGNDEAGIVIVSDPGVTVGGTASGAPNTIAFNGQDGVQVFPPNT
ncbi:MAG: CSLREA domain-containing protein, partial [Pseudonocardiaceae bacterium]